MAFDREAAKKAGYSDQEIDQYLAQQQAGSDEPPPPSTQVPEIDRTNSNLATAAGAVGSAVVPSAMTVLGGAGALKGWQVANQWMQNSKSIADMKAAADAGHQAIQRAKLGAKGISVPSTGAVAPPPGAPMTQAVAPKIAQAAGEQSIKSIAMQGIARGAAGVAQAVAPYAAVAAIPGAMMAHDYANFQQQTPDQQYESAQSALAGQSPGQAW